MLIEVTSEHFMSLLISLLVQRMTLIPICPFPIPGEMKIKTRESNLAGLNMYWGAFSNIKFI